MKKSLAVVISCAVLILLFGWIYNSRHSDKVTLGNKPVSYLNAIEKVYASDIKGMAVEINKVDNLQARNPQIYNVATGNNENDFSANSVEGEKLKSTKQLFLQLKRLKVLNEGASEVIAPNQDLYYMIQTNHDYDGKNRTDIYYLNLFVNPKTYGIYQPKSYYGPDELQKISTTYIEYEPDEEARNLINAILKIPSENNMKEGKEINTGFWETISEKYGRSIDDFSYYDGSLQLTVPILIEGMKHKDAAIRWYSANKAIEYDGNQEVAQLKEMLFSLENDTDLFVKEAAKLALAVFNGQYNHPAFIRYKDSSKYVFYRFREAKYNDGAVWMIDSGKVSQLFKDSGSSIMGLDWSPDGEWVGVTRGGRTWIDVNLVQVQTKENREINLIRYAFGNAEKYGYKVKINQRPDPYIGLIEWSPDSRKVLLSCQFTDDDYQEQACIAVYNLDAAAIERFLKLPPEQEQRKRRIQKPKGLEWY